MAELKSLHIYKASAGSGKTHTLVHEYLNLLYGIYQSSRGKTIYPEGYKRILVATFTNKATTELRERIVKELYKKHSEGDLLAGEILEEILLDYSSLRVQTIDSFFQEVVRSFVFELNSSGASAELVLDSDRAIEMSVDQLLMSLPIDRIEGLERLLSEGIESGKYTDIQKAICEIAIQMLYHPLSKEYDLSAISYTDIQESDIELRAIRDKRYKAMDEAYTECYELLQSHEGELDSSAYKFLSNLYNKSLDKLISTQISEGETSIIDKRVSLESEHFIVAKKYRGKEEYAHLEEAEEAFREAILRLQDTLNTNVKDYQLAKLLRRYLPYLPLLSDVQQEVKRYQKEHKVILIEEINSLVDRVIDGSSIPFIYEKVGGRIDHYMIDEFQDTDGTQWHNFKLLLKEGLDKGNQSYLVGDVKQSIYRFRGTDSSLLNSGVETDTDLLPFVSTKPLKDNWRSDEMIVAFNNAFFQDIYHFDTHCGGEKNTAINADIYRSNILQTPKKENGKGYIRFEYIPEKSNEDADTLKDRIQDILVSIQEKDGYQAGDIAFLVRENKDAQKVAQLLEILTKEDPQHRNCYSFVSDFALRVDQARIVKLIVALFQLGADPDNVASQTYFEVACYMLSPEVAQRVPEFTEMLHSGASMTEIIYRLLSVVEVPQEEELYLNAFLDLLHTFIEREPNTYQSFNKWWAKVGANSLVSMGDSDSNKIQIITIHKAKGLEKPIVIMPFVNWKLSKDGPQSTGVDFCKSSYLPEGFMDHALPFYIIPSSVTNVHLHSHIRQRYMEIHEANYLDTLNLLYVAFTRPKNRLYLFTNVPEDASKTNIVSTIVYDRIKSIPDIRECGDASWSLGEETPKEGDSGAKVKEMGTKDASQPVTLHFDLYNKPLELPSLRVQPPFDNINTLHGKTMHDIMARANTPEDIKRAVNCLSLSEDDKDKIIAHFLKTFESNPIIRYAFTPNKDKLILREDSVYIPQSRQIERPDRVVIEGKKAIVIDFKFGAVTNNPSHHRQVRRYMNRLEETGLSAEGYLWYWQAEEEIVKVEKK